MLTTIKENKLVSSILAVAMVVGAIVSIGKGFEWSDKYICTEAEAGSMIQQSVIPAERNRLEKDISDIKRDIFVLEQKAQYGKDEPWEPKLLEQLEEDLDELEADKDELNKVD